MNHGGPTLTVVKKEESSMVQITVFLCRTKRNFMAPATEVMIKARLIETVSTANAITWYSGGNYGFLILKENSISHEWLKSYCLCR